MKLLSYSLVAISSLIIGIAIGRRTKSTKLADEDILNVVNGIGNRENMAILYKKLIVKVHPDKNENKDLATEYTALLNKYRRNYNKLLELENEINLKF